MLIFFYGTLADRELLSLVTGRIVEPSELKPACLHGYRRVQAKDELFPVCLPGIGAMTEGMVMLSATTRDRERIEFYEGVDYTMEPLTIEIDGVSAEAITCQPTERIEVTDTLWSLEDWSREDRLLSLLEAEEVMAAFGILDYEETEAKWPEMRDRARKRFELGERAAVPR